MADNMTDDVTAVIASLVDHADVPLANSAWGCQEPKTDRKLPWHCISCPPSGFYYALDCQILCPVTVSFQPPCSLGKLKKATSDVHALY